MINEQEADLITQFLDKSFEKFLTKIEILGDDKVDQELAENQIIEISDVDFPRFEWVIGRETGLDNYLSNEFIRGFSLHISYRYKDNMRFIQEYELIKDLKRDEIKYKKIHTEVLLLGEDGDAIGYQVLFSSYLSLDETIMK